MSRRKPTQHTALDTSNSHWILADAKPEYRTKLDELIAFPPEHPTLVSHATGDSLRLFNTLELDGYDGDGVVLLQDTPEIWYTEASQVAMLDFVGIPFKCGKFLYEADAPRITSMRVTRTERECWWAWRVQPVLASVFDICTFLHTNNLDHLLLRNDHTSIDKCFVWGETREDALTGIIGHQISFTK